MDRQTTYTRFHVTLSVCPSVRQSRNEKAHQVNLTSVTAPVHPYMADAVVYTALFHNITYTSMYVKKELRCLG